MKIKYPKLILLLIVAVIFSFNGCNEKKPTEITDDDEINTWVNVTNGLPNSINTIASSGSFIYVFAEYKLYSSSNNGESWKSIGSGLPDSTRINAISGFNNYLVAATSGKGVFISYDYGEMWFEPANVGLDVNSKFVNSIEMDSEFIYIGAGLDAIVYRSSDLGNNWIPFSDGLPIRTPVYIPRINLLIKNNNILFACPFAEGIYYSENNAVNWYEMNEGINIGSHPWVFSLAISDSFYFANITQQGIYRRSFNGNSWNKVLDNTSDYDPHFVVAQGHKVLASQNTGLVISFDNGTSWKSCNKGLNNIVNPYFYYAVIHEGFVFAAENYGSIYRYSLK